MADMERKYQHHPHDSQHQLSPQESWNNLYSEKEQVWSGEPNKTLVSLIENHAPTTVLDLGCGEGGDVLWLAQHGWDATGIDISDIAIERARNMAQKIGVSAQFVAADLAHWRTEQTFDLVVSSFMQSHFDELDRIGIFQQALELLNVGGELVSISHAGMPSFIKDDDPRMHFAESLPNPSEEAQALTRNDSRFEIKLAEKRTRSVASPEGEEGTIDDGVMVIRRIR
ncbi:MAG: class I SAM-dependent methyltransferase [Rothia sp. (in: high G+C Gram-positive bacteria)]|nr:class I SAM-dependent methyltransferase [Rothia sp. (in: high G+C Gram-positive bacteria)]